MRISRGCHCVCLLQAETTHARPVAFGTPGRPTARKRNHNILDTPGPLGCCRGLQPEPEERLQEAAMHSRARVRRPQAADGAEDRSTSGSRADGISGASRAALPAGHPMFEDLKAEMFSVKVCSFSTSIECGNPLDWWQVLSSIVTLQDSCKVAVSLNKVVRACRYCRSQQQRVHAQAVRITLLATGPGMHQHAFAAPNRHQAPDVRGDGKLCLLGN